MRASRPTGRAAGPPGRCEHRPLQGFDVTQGLRFPGWGGLVIPYPPAGVAACGGRASRPTAPGWAGPSRLARRGGIYPPESRGRSPGTMRIVPWFKTQNFPVGRAPAVGCRGGFHIRPRGSRRRGVRRDEGIPPYGRPGGRFARRKVPPGRCEHRPLQGFDVTQSLRFPGRPGRWVQRRCSCMRSQVFSTSMSRMMSMGNLMMFLTRRRLLSTTKDWP